jgi:hypothetical protein
VAATVHASDCQHQYQQSILPFIQPLRRGSLNHQRMPNPWRSCFNHIHWPECQSVFRALFQGLPWSSLAPLSKQWQFNSPLWILLWNWMPWCKIYRNLQYLYPSMCFASRISLREVKPQHLWVLSAEHGGPTTRMWPNAPKTIPSWIPQAQRGNQG